MKTRLTIKMTVKSTGETLSAKFHDFDTMEQAISMLKKIDKEMIKNLLLFTYELQEINAD